ncbi:MAG: IS4/IS5 family transposase, partial [Desulfobacterales bacterium]
MPKLIAMIENTIDSEDFQKRHKESSKDFIRNTALSFKNLIAFFANLNKGSYETELKAFYKTINNQEV